MDMSEKLLKHCNQTHTQTIEGTPVCLKPAFEKRKKLVEFRCRLYKNTDRRQCIRRVTKSFKSLQPTRFLRPCTSNFDRCKVRYSEDHVSNRSTLFRHQCSVHRIPALSKPAEEQFQAHARTCLFLLLQDALEYRNGALITCFIAGPLHTFKSDLASAEGTKLISVWSRKCSNRVVTTCCNI